MKRPTCVDLFCGCGGFCLGLQRAGLTILAAIDFNEEAIATFKKNFPDVQHALGEDRRLIRNGTGRQHVQRQSSSIGGRISESVMR